MSRTIDKPGSAEGDLDREVRNLITGSANLDVLAGILIDFVVWANSGPQWRW